MAKSNNQKAKILYLERMTAGDRGALYLIHAGNPGEACEARINAERKSI